MKSYKNKKIYNFKEKHNRKRRTRSAVHYWKVGSSYYLLSKRQAYRIKCKEILRRNLNGESIEYPLYKKTLYWDS